MDLPTVITISSTETDAAPVRAPARLQLKRAASPLSESICTSYGSGSPASKRSYTVNCAVSTAQRADSDDEETVHKFVHTRALCDDCGMCTVDEVRIVSEAELIRHCQQRYKKCSTCAFPSGRTRVITEARCRRCPSHDAGMMALIVRCETILPMRDPIGPLLATAPVCPYCRA